MAVYVPIVGIYRYRDGSPAVGRRVRFTPRSRGRSDAIEVRRPVVAVTDDDGAVALELQATDDPGSEPAGWTYEVSEDIDGAGAPWDLQVPAGTVGPLDLATVAPVDSALGRVIPIPGVVALDVLAAQPDFLIVGPITRDGNGAALSAGVVWPDGTPGAYTALVVSTAFPGAVDSYSITYGSPAAHTYTQPAVTRDPITGVVTDRPAIEVT